MRTSLILFGTMALLSGAGRSLQAAPAPAVRAAQDSVRPLQRAVSLDLRDVPLGEALDEIDRQAGLGLTYTPRVVPVGRRVTLRAAGLTAREALGRVLDGTGVEVTETPDGAVMLRKSEAKTKASLGAPTGSVFGIVTDSATARPLAGVEVMVRGTELSAITTAQGGYGWKDVPAGPQTLIVRLIGYAPMTREITVAEGQTVRADFAMRMQPTRLTELVTTATGERLRVELGNDITVIDADSIVRTQPISSVTDLLEGRVPGMVIQRSSGAPGDPSRIRLRGASSPNLSNDPIVIVDGIRVYSQQSGQRGGNLADSRYADVTAGTTTPYATPSPLDYIDPHTIETIEVVKGPSAATLYGQDAANGVIVVTTKRGRPGPTRWTVTAEQGMTEMANRYPDLMLRWGHRRIDGEPVPCPISNVSGNDVTGAAPCVADSTVYFQMLHDPELTVLDRGSRTSVSLGVSGGTDALTYNITTSYLDDVGLVRLPGYLAARYRQQEGQAPPDWMERPQGMTQWGVASRLVARLGQRADVSLSTSLSRGEQRRSSLERQLGSFMGTYLDRGTGTYYRSNGFRDLAPVDTSKLTDFYERARAIATTFTTGATLNWRVRSWLTTTAEIGVNAVQRADDIFVPRIGELIGSLRPANGASLSSTANVRANLTLPLKAGFRFLVATGISYAGESVNDVMSEVRGLAKGSEEPTSTAQFSVARRRSAQATFGWYVEPQINHRRFWLSSGIRFDGGSNFGSQAKLAAFPKLSLSYLLSDESFFPWKEAVPMLRLRAAYGHAGRQPGPVDRLRLYGAANPVWINGELVEVISLSKLGNTKLEPERTQELEVGFDAGFHEDRVTVSFTGFRKTTRDMIMRVPVASSVYGQNVNTLRNIGMVRNEGLEASVGADVVRSDPVTWNLNVSVSHQKNNVIELGPGVQPFYTQGGACVSGFVGQCGGTRVAPGYPLFGRWTAPLLGYADADGDGVLAQDEILYGDTAVFVGGTLPNYQVNLHTSIRLLRGALAVSAGFLYEGGMTQSNEVGRTLAAFTRGRNDPTAPLEEQARMWDESGFSWVQTVNTLRFNSLAVTYNVPGAVARRLGARSASVSVQGSNLGLRTNYRGVDPGVNAFAMGNAVTDTGVLPRPRTWQVRLNATY